MCHKLRQGGETWCSLNVWGTFNHKLRRGGESWCSLNVWSQIVSRGVQCVYCTSTGGVWGCMVIKWNSPM